MRFRECSTAQICGGDVADKNRLAVAGALFRQIGQQTRALQPRKKNVARIKFHRLPRAKISRRRRAKATIRSRRQPYVGSFALAIQRARSPAKEKRKRSDL